MADSEDTQVEKTQNLRACCKILQPFCDLKPCCFTSSSLEKVHSSSESLIPRAPDASNEKSTNTTAYSADNVGPGEPIQLEIRGMDCADCLPKVKRALKQLPSVTPVAVDYFSGTADILYDPEIIASEAICSYVARATGFSVKIAQNGSGDKGEKLNTITLPIQFHTMPPTEAFKELKIDIYSPNTVEVSLPIQSDSIHRPRDVLENLRGYGAQLLPPRADSGRSRATRDLIDASFRTLACAILTVPVLVLAWAKIPHRPVLYGGISLGLTTIIQIIALHILTSAFRSVFYLRQIDMSVLVATSTLSAYSFSVVSYACEVAGKPFAKPFFETTALLITLILLGRNVSSATRRSTGTALRELERLQATDVLLLSKENETDQKLDSRLLFYGDVIRVPPDSRIATDGVVVGGSSDVDESPITGESAAVPKWKGSRVIAGTLNLGGTLDVQVTRLIHENSLSRIMSLVNEAQSSRSPVQNLADRLSALILPVALVSSCLALLIWSLVGRYVRSLSPVSSFVEALTYAIAILVVSCPCAIGLAVRILPIVLFVSSLIFYSDTYDSRCCYSCRNSRRFTFSICGSIASRIWNRHCCFR